MYFALICRCHMQGNFFITIGYSRYKDKQNETHGWVMFGHRCVADQRKIQAVVAMLVMGFEAPEEITPPVPVPWGDLAGHWRHATGAAAATAVRCRRCSHFAGRWWHCCNVQRHGL